MSTTKSVIAVYGTLKRGHGNYNYLLRDKAKFLGEAITVDKFVLMDFGGFPGLFPSDPKGRYEPTHVHVELFEVDAATLKNCDGLEGHPNWYRRTPIKVMLTQVDAPADEGACLTDCEVYMQQKEPHGIFCEQGVWPRVSKLQRA